MKRKTVFGFLLLFGLLAFLITGEGNLSNAAKSENQPSNARDSHLNQNPFSGYSLRGAENKVETLDDQFAQVAKEIPGFGGLRGFVTNSHSTAVQGGVVDNPESLLPDRPDLNGYRFINPVDGKIYLILDGKRRHIPNVATFYNLFRDDRTNMHNDLLVDYIPEGAPLSDGAVLAYGKLGAAQTGVYLVSNGVKRHVTSPAAMDKYWFNWNKLIQVPLVLIEFITEGPPIS